MFTCVCAYMYIYIQPLPTPELTLVYNVGRVSQLPWSCLQLNHSIMPTHSDHTLLGIRHKEPHQALYGI